MDTKDKIIEDLQRHLRENLPPERVDETFDYEITDEDVQGLDLTPTYVAGAGFARLTCDTMTVEGFRRSMMLHRDRFLELVRNLQ